MEDLNKLYTFIRVAQRLSFSQAAADLKITPSSVSKQIAEFESRVGAQLLIRSTRGVALTEVGKTLYEQCVHLVSELDRAITNASDIYGSVRGHLRICCVAGYAQAVIAPLIPKFISENPEIGVELISVGSGPNLTEEGIDVVIRSKILPDPSLAFREIGPVKYVVCASPDYFARHGVPQSPKDLEHHNCMTHSIFAPAEWRFMAKPRDLVVRVRGTFQSNNALILLEAALQGSGIVRLPEYVVRNYIQRGDLCPIFPDLNLSRQVMRIYFASVEHLPGKIASFLKFLEKDIGFIGGQPQG